MEANKNENTSANADHSNNEAQANLDKFNAENPDMTDAGTEEGYNSGDPDKYLALEQDGVTFTPDSNAPLLNSDNIEDGIDGNQDVWDDQQRNNRNSEAFNQDDYLLEDNLEIDEEKSQSISSDDN